MKESWLKFFDLGLVHSAAYPEVKKGEGPVVETAEAIARDDFFSAIEITSVQDEATRRRLAWLLEVSHLRPLFSGGSAMVVHNMNINSLDEAERRASVQMVNGFVDQAYFFGAEHFMLVPGKDPGPERRNEGKDSLVRSLVEICSYARERKPDKPLMVTLEIFDRDVAQKRIIGPIGEAAELAEEVRKKEPNFGLTLDLSHLPATGETPREALAASQAHIVHLHMGNFVLERTHPLFGDTHPRFGLKGGANDVAEILEFLEALFEVRFFDHLRPIVSMEVRPHGSEPVGLVIANAKRAFLSAWSKL